MALVPSTLTSGRAQVKEYAGSKCGSVRSPKLCDSGVKGGWELELGVVLEGWK
jgi:hypothetical protein